MKELIKIKTRTYLFVGEKKVKMTPKKYQKIPVLEIEKLISDNGKLILTETEKKPIK